MKSLVIISIASVFLTSCSATKSLTANAAAADSPAEEHEWTNQRAARWNTKWFPRWAPAITHSESMEIINAVLADWSVEFRNHKSLEAMYKDAQTGLSLDYIPINLKRVHLIRQQLPKSFVPCVESVSFILVNHEPSEGDKPLYGKKPGDIGIRFDQFELERRDTVEFCFCLFRYFEGQTYEIDGATVSVIGGLGFTYEVKKIAGKWVPKLIMIRS